IGRGEFNLPHAICIDTQGRIVVGDRENDRIQLFDPEGKFLTQWKAGGAPFGLFSTADGRLFVPDGRATPVTVLNRQGQVLDQWGESGTGSGQFSLPHAVCVDSRGDVYVAEVNGQRVQKFTPK